MSGGLISGGLYPGASIRELLSRDLYPGGLYPGNLYLGDLYPGTYIRWLITGGLYPRANIWGLISEAYVQWLLSVGSWRPGGLYPGGYIRGDISGGLYSVVYIRAAYIQGAYVPHWHTDSEQVNKRLSPTNSKELHSRFTKTDRGFYLCARQLLLKGENVTNGPKYSKGPKCNNHFKIEIKIDLMT